MKQRILLPVLFVFSSVIAFAQNATDKDWKAQSEALTGTLEAEFTIRVGDIDNLGFEFPEGFDPFCGRMTQAHSFPWDPRPEDKPGFDRILLGSKFNPESPKGCGSDGYSFMFATGTTRPVPYKIPLSLVQGKTITNAWLQLFIDDFQSPSLCSEFTMSLNGKRFPEGERILNAIDQTGPVGKLISIPLPEDYYSVIAAGGELTLTIDETKGVADGYAIDFIRLLVNRKRENTCRGDVSGIVLDKETNEPVPFAMVYQADHSSVKADAEGRFTLRGIPTGLEVLSASAKGYNDGFATADVGEGSDNPEVQIFLEKATNAAMFDGQKLQAGSSISLNKILFDQGKSDLRPESITELDKIVAFLKENANAEIELSGHTSSEGDAAYNRSLSYRRVKACKDYIVGKGIDTGRITVVGYGPDKPAASNDTEAGRAQNRRVEMRVLKL